MNLNVFLVKYIFCPPKYHIDLAAAFSFLKDNNTIIHMRGTFLSTISTDNFEPFSRARVYLVIYLSTGRYLLSKHQNIIDKFNLANFNLQIKMRLSNPR